MGYTMRINAWRLTLWLRFDWGKLWPKWAEAPVGIELYAQAGDVCRSAATSTHMSWPMWRRSTRRSWRQRRCSSSSTHRSVVE
jgi:hypothetical protein